MSVEASAIRSRWDALRGREDCNLSLSKEAVAVYLSKSETDIVKERILETLLQLADLRIREKLYGVGKGSSGDLATCEGLETFLVPAVEEALPFSVFLNKCKDKSAFAETFTQDVNDLLDNWVEGRFSAAPYTDTDKIEAAMTAARTALFTPFNITEAAAMACRVTIHILTLKFQSDNEDEFNRAIGRHLADERLCAALTQAINFLVEAFQKSAEGGDIDTRIANAAWDNLPGSGWSWTANPPGTRPLAPMLFFTAAAVDAFAELDLYLMRPPFDKKITCDERIRRIYTDNEASLKQLQLCVDMARRWVQSAVLLTLTSGDGQHPETYPDRETPMEVIWDAPASKGVKPAAPPTLYYNTLYALQILLWSFGDRKDDGTEDEVAKSRINQAITLLVDKYQNTDGIRAALARVRHKFLLPGQGVFSKSDLEAGCVYEDAGFLPLMTRLLVLFVVYGVGDRNLLEPIVRNLYVELLQRRNRQIKENRGALWSTEQIEIFSTQRAIQSLTFYHAYAAGKELVDKGRGGGGGTGGGNFEFVNMTDRRIVLQIVDAGAQPAPAANAKEKAQVPAITDPRVQFKERLGDDLADYLAKIKWRPGPPSASEGASSLQAKAQELLEKVYVSGQTLEIPDPDVTGRLVDGLLELWKTPVKNKLPREEEFESLKKEYSQAIGSKTEHA
jgi:hypothetical protein